VSSAETSSVFRKTSATLSGGDTIGLDYALQSGVGGIDLGSGVEINGDVYTAGSIRADSNASISGLAVAGRNAPQRFNTTAKTRGGRQSSHRPLRYTVRCWSSI
jgi:hypothetical protein